MIKEVGFDETKFNDLPWKFEAGTPNIAEGIGLGVAVDYLSKLGMDKILKNDKKITIYATERMKEIKDLTIYGPRNRGAIISFNVKGVHPHDISQILDSEGVAIRAGHHCCMPLMKTLGVNATARASFYLYNTKKEVDVMIDAIGKVKKIFGI